jgi:hypothetical protein
MAMPALYDRNSVPEIAFSVLLMLVFLKAQGPASQYPYSLTCGDAECHGKYEILHGPIAAKN